MFCMNDANYCINAMYDLLWEIIKENGPCMRRGGGGQMVSMLAFYPTIRVQIPLTLTVFCVKFCVETNENKQKVFLKNTGRY